MHFEKNVMIKSHSSSFVNSYVQYLQGYFWYINVVKNMKRILKLTYNKIKYKTWDRWRKFLKELKEALSEKKVPQKYI